MTAGRGLVGGLVAAAVIAVAAAPPSAIAQVSGPVADGTFAGDIMIDGGFITSDDRFTVEYTLDGTGPIEVTLVDGRMDGTFDLPGSGTMIGTSPDGAFTMDGTIDFRIAGTVGGPPGAYRMEATYDSTTQVTIGAGGVTTSASDTASDRASEALTDVIVLCDYLLGRFDLRIAQEIEGTGMLRETISGLFQATTRYTHEELAAEIADLRSDVNAWAAEGAPYGPELAWSEGMDLVQRSAELQQQMSEPSPCPNDARFVTEVTLAAQDVLGEMIDLYPGTTAIPAATLALASGAIGDGAANPAAAQALQQKMQVDLAQRFADVDFNNSDALIDIATTARMIGVDSFQAEPAGPVFTPGDLLLLTGAGE